MDFALRSCSWRGHATYAPDEPELRERLRADTVAGEAWRCLRCETFVVGSPRARGPADEAPDVPRGRLLRDRLIMRLLAVERVFRALIFGLLAFGVLRVRGSEGQLARSFERDIPLIRPIADQMGWNPDGSKVIARIEHWFSLSPTTLTWIAAGLAMYALIETIEAVGLWLMQRWGEYFAVVATCVFLPLEIYELTERVTPFRLGALALNIAAVVWLLWTKRLFGVNGGGRAYRSEHEAASLLTVERAAVDVGGDGRR